MSKRKRGPITAAEAMAELAADEEYQARLRARNRAIDERVARDRAEAAPLLHDLRELGIDVESPWDLANRPNDYQHAYPVLVTHFQRPYSERNLEGITRALTVPDARKIAWSVLRDAFIANTDTSTSGLKFALGNALGEIMDEGVLSDVFAMVVDVRHGENRSPMVEGLGHHNDREDVRAVLAKLVDDPDVAGDAKKALARKRRRRR